ncbi:FAD-binding oxidoreductase [Nocardioides sp. GY 10127]|uniref:NAD(P)/FAD-dependent oxidoreductase n=1 Tax=Nocardioides sp. GY 10127 TaxID=2569762 RepID=UPI001F116AEE|nr:FAD-binding oxidoreductase [Nocardioides sp. GY 10127]
MPTAALPTRASVVIIGGGIMGLSTAYHLARAGVRDVVLLEKDEFGSGSTSKAAGGVRANFSDAVNIELGQRSLRTFERFREDFGQEIDLHQVGYLFLLDDPAHVAAFEANVALQNSMGVPSRMIDVAEAMRLSPYINPEGLLGAAWSPNDGHCTPESVVLGYAGAARRAGATLLRNTPVEGIESDGSTITGVRTPAGTIATDTVVCTAGAWSKALGEMVGVDLPIEPVRRQIVVTEQIPNLDPRTPFTIDFSTTFYFHNEGNALLLGMSDPDETPGFKLQRSDDWLPGLADAIERRAPEIGEFGIASGWAGLYEVTPDHNAVIGEAAGVSRFLYAAGFSGHGFLQGPAVGEVMRDLYLGRPPVVDVSGMTTDRFAPAAAGVGGIRPELNIV